MPKYIESYDLLPEKVKEQSRAIQSLIEEVEAVDFYNQRAALCTDPELKAILEHNRDEEAEHSMMLLEWLRRNMEAFGKEAPDYLFTTGSIVSREEEATGKSAEETSESNSDLGNIFSK